MMDKKVEVKVRLTCISVLLKEIEDIICEQKREPQHSKNVSTVCECRQESRSTDEKLLVQTKLNNIENCYKKKKIKNVDSEKYLRSLDLSPDVNDDALNVPISNNKCQVKNKLKIPHEKILDIKNEYNIQEEYDAEKFKCNLNDMKHKILLYFDDIKKN